MTESPGGGGLSGYVSGKTSGIGFSKGVGKGVNVYDVIVGLRTFPICEKPLAGKVSDDAGSEVKVPRYVDEGSVDSEEKPGGGRDEEGDTTLPGGGSTVGEGEFGFWAPTVPKRASKEYSTEKDPRNMVGEGRRP